MNPGGHALGRRVSELRVAQQALAAEARALEAGGTFGLLAAGNHFTGATAERARPARAQVAELWRCLALLDDLLGRVEQQTEDGYGDDYHAARLGALLNGPVIVVAPDASPESATPVRFRGVHRALRADQPLAVPPGPAARAQQRALPA